MPRVAASEKNICLWGFFVLHECCVGVAGHTLDFPTHKYELYLEIY